MVSSAPELDAVAIPLPEVSGARRRSASRPPWPLALTGVAIGALFALPVAYLAYPGEQHGFRKAENIVRSLEAELYFYGKVFGFVPADRIEPVSIDNLDS